MVLKKLIGQTTVIAIALFMLSSFAYARRSVNYDGPVVVNVAVLNATEIEFPEEIATVVMGMPNEKISIEHTKNMIFIQPLTADLDGDIYVVGKSGRSYVLSLNVVDKTARDRQIKIAATDEIARERVEQLKFLTPLSLMKAMALNQELDGVFIESKTFVIYESKGLKMTVTKTYDAVGMKGYLVRIENSTETPFDFRTLSMKGLVAFSYYKDNTGFLVFYV